MRARSHRSTLPGWRSCLAILLFCAATPAAAQLADCVGELNESQQEQRNVCDTFLPCQWVSSLFDTCRQTKAWLGNLATASPSGEISLQTVESAARQMSVVEMRNEEVDDGPALIHCLSGDRELCRQYLGLDPMPIRVAGPPPKRSADVQRRARMLALYKEEDRARARLGGPWGSAVSALAACESSRLQSDRVATCQRAQREVDACAAARIDWGNRKTALLAEIERLTPAVGMAYTPGLSPLRGLGPQANSDQLWNDTVRGLKALEIAACPATLPSSFMTPEQALAAWAREEATHAADIARCDGMSREAFAAIDQGDLARATMLADAFESSCARLAPSYASRAQLAKSQISALRSAEAMPVRSTGYGTSLFKNAVQQARVEAQDPAARQARLDAERAELERKIATEAASGGDGSQFLGMMVGAMQIAAAAQGSSNRVQAPIAAQQIVQYPLQQQAQPQQSMQPLQPSQQFQPSQPSQPSQQQAQWMAQQQALANARNQQAAQVAEQYRQQSELMKYYAPINHCASVSNPVNSNFRYCIRNGCESALSVHFSGGLLDVPIAACVPVSGFPTIHAVCRYHDGFDRGRQQCKRP